ncbi:MAG TPA: thioredoxin family protein [Geothrix sp.]|nr:thioredoxin family protein [Geothrix sp.]
MKAAILALGTVGALAQTPPIAPPLPPAQPGGLHCDPKDKLPLLLGPATAQEILAHRAIFRDTLAKAPLSGGLKARWKAVKRPFTLVAVFGSWCGDSHYQLPDLLALEAEPNPFIEVHYLGVYRDKQVPAAQWPAGCPAQKVLRVPTFYLFATQPGGGQKLVGTVVENPPRAGQRMAEALVELVEAASTQ